MDFPILTCDFPCFCLFKEQFPYIKLLPPSVIPFAQADWDVSAWMPGVLSLWPVSTKQVAHGPGGKWWAYLRYLQIIIVLLIEWDALRSLCQSCFPWQMLRGSERCVVVRLGIWDDDTQGLQAAEASRDGVHENSHNEELSLQAAEAPWPSPALKDWVPHGAPCHMTCSSMFF